MHKGRIEAFSDGVIAIIITIMVLEFKTPLGDSWNDFVPLLPIIGSYLLSFIFVGIYWNNHHHLFQAVKKVNGLSLWANLHLLFWLSLTPFGTAWLGHSHFASVPVAVYGVILMMSGVAYYILVRALLATKENTTLEHAIGSDVKGKISVVIYAFGIAIAFWNSAVAYALFVAVALMWLVPDRRIEKTLQAEK